MVALGGYGQLKTDLGNKFDEVSGKLFGSLNSVLDEVFNEVSGFEFCGNANISHFKNVSAQSCLVEVPKRETAQGQGYHQTIQKDQLVYEKQDPESVHQMFDSN
jgi:hypothetical protein